MHDFGSSVLCCTPSYALFLADAIKDSGFPREEFKLRIGVFGAEPWTENMSNQSKCREEHKAYSFLYIHCVDIVSVINRNRASITRNCG